MRQPESSCDAGRHRHGPVDAGGDDPGDVLCAGDRFDRFLVLGRDDRVPVGERETDRVLVPVAGDDGVAPGPGRPEQSELRRPGA